VQYRGKTHLIQGNFPSIESLLLKIKAALSITDEIELLLFDEKVQEYVVIHSIESVPGESRLRIQETTSITQGSSPSPPPFISPARAFPSENSPNQEPQEIARLKQELEEERKEKRKNEEKLEKKELELEEEKMKREKKEQEFLQEKRKNEEKLEKKELELEQAKQRIQELEGELGKNQGKETNKKRGFFFKKSSKN